MFANVLFKATLSVTFDLLFFEIVFLFFKNTAKKTKIQVYILPISLIFTNYQYQNNSIYVKLDCL